MKKDITNPIRRSNSLNGSNVYTQITINVLKQKNIHGEYLSKQELTALQNFEKYEEYQLDQTNNEIEFEEKLKELITLANLTPFEEFLKDKYKTS